LCFRQSIASEVVETEVISAPAEPQPPPPPPEPPLSGACGGADVTAAESPFCGSKPLGRPLSDSTLTDAERTFLARYPCIDRLQLAELREAFLLTAAGSATTTPRAAVAAADTARLDAAADIGTCLRAVGHNPTQADIARITSVMQQQQRQEVSL